VGIKDFFSSSGRREKRLERLIRSATNPYGQSADRYHAMEQLLELESDEAFVGLLKRFTVTSTKSIEDEEEKGWVYRQLSAMGPKVLPAAKEFCLTHDNIAWALRIVEDVADADAEWDILNTLLERHLPEYARSSATKLQLLTHLSDIDHEQVPVILIRYLEDPDENVRFFAVETLADIGDPRAKEPMVARLALPEEDSVRLRTRILEALAQTGWDVSEHLQVISKNLGNEHLVRDGKVVKR
jgi:HEAT repeat protein